MIIGKKYINIENFIEDVESAMKGYFDELEYNKKLQEFAKNRIRSMSILENYESNEKNDEYRPFYQTGVTSNEMLSGSTNSDYKE